MCNNCEFCVCDVIQKMKETKGISTKPATAENYTRCYEKIAKMIKEERKKGKRYGNQKNAVQNRAITRSQTTNQQITEVKTQKIVITKAKQRKPSKESISNNTAIKEKIEEIFKKRMMELVNK